MSLERELLAEEERSAQDIVDQGLDDRDVEAQHAARPRTRCESAAPLLAALLVPIVALACVAIVWTHGGGSADPHQPNDDNSAELFMAAPANTSTPGSAAQNAQCRASWAARQSPTAASARGLRSRGRAR